LRVLRYLLAMQLFANVAAPFFTPYMLNHLELSYGQFMTLTASSFAARVGVLPLLGRVAKVGGAGRLLWLGGLGIAPLPALWLVSDAFAYLLVVQLIAGCAWAAVELATTLAYFEGIAEEDRASVLTAFNLANALAIALGSLLGAQILGYFEASASAYVWLFAASTAGRLLAATLLRRMPAPRGEATEVSLRTLAVRPAGGTVQRPILATITESAPDASRRAGQLPDAGEEE
jgi:MFS family permease